MKNYVVLFFLFFSNVALSQSSENVSIPNIKTESLDVVEELSVEVLNSQWVSLRVLDKLGGVSTEFEAKVGLEVKFGSLLITVEECRYPAGNPNSNSFAYLRITNFLSGAVELTGWMIASSPALKALDHARYDVSLIRCKLEQGRPVLAVLESWPHPLMRPIEVFDN
jgi:hypothetical protein